MAEIKKEKKLFKVVRTLIDKRRSKYFCDVLAEDEEEVKEIIKDGCHSCLTTQSNPEILSQEEIITIDESE